MPTLAGVTEGEMVNVPKVLGYQKGPVFPVVIPSRLDFTSAINKYLEPEF